jgi:hypothetical protein
VPSEPLPPLFSTPGGRPLQTYTAWGYRRKARCYSAPHAQLRRVPLAALAVTWRAIHLKPFFAAPVARLAGKWGKESTVRCWCWAAKPCRALGRLRGGRHLVVWIRALAAAAAALRARCLRSIAAGHRA